MMAVETENRDVEKLVKGQKAAIAAFFGVTVPTPPDRLFVVCNKIQAENLWTPEPLYVPHEKLSEGRSVPGLTHPLGAALYKWMRQNYVDADVDLLPGQWIIWDPIRRPDDSNGYQMYPDTGRFKELLVDLRGRADGIEVSDYSRRTPEGSRFGISADEIDGSRNLVAGEIARILDLQEGEVISTPSYASFNYVGNLCHPELGEVTTSEWLRDRFGRGDRLDGGDSDFGGLSGVYSWQSDDRSGLIGFRLQIAFLS